MKQAKLQNATPAKCGRLANPYVDSQFKLIFDEESTRLFLNSVLRLKVPIRTLTIRNSESNDTSSVGRRVYFDVFCEDEDGNRFIVEMQRAWQSFLKNRLIYYICRKMDEMGRDYETKDGGRTIHGWNYDIKRVYMVCLLDDRDKDLTKQKFRQDISFYDVENHRQFSDKLMIVMINLKMLEDNVPEGCTEYYRNFLHLLQSISSDMTTAKELLRDIDESTLNEEQKSIFRRVVNLSDVSSMTEEQRLQYEEELRNEWDYSASMNESFNNGKAEGIAEGLAEGEAKGKMQVARNLLKLGLPLAQVSEATGLSEEQLAERQTD